MLRRALSRLRQVQVHALAVVHAPFDLVRVHHDGGQAGDERDALRKDIRQRLLFRVVVIGIQRQNAARHLVHDIRRRRLHDHVLGKVLGQLAVSLQHLLERSQLVRRGQAAEQKQPDDLLEYEAVLRVCRTDDLFHINAPVDELAVRWHAFAVHKVVANDVADVCQPRQNAGAIRVPQASLDPQPFAGFRVDEVIFEILVA